MGRTIGVSTHCLQDRRRTGTATGVLGVCNWRAHSAHDGSRWLFERFAVPNRGLTRDISKRLLISTGDARFCYISDRGKRGTTESACLCRRCLSRDFVMIGLQSPWA